MMDDACTCRMRDAPWPDDSCMLTLWSSAYGTAVGQAVGVGHELERMMGVHCCLFLVQRMYRRGEVAYIDTR